MSTDPLWGPDKKQRNGVLPMKSMRIRMWRARMTLPDTHHTQVE